LIHHRANGDEQRQNERCANTKRIFDPSSHSKVGRGR
jgi:hypothetical protein